MRDVPAKKERQMISKKKRQKLEIYGWMMERIERKWCSDGGNGFFFSENCAATTRAWASGIAHCCPICSYFIWWMFVRELITFLIHFSSDSSSDWENKLAELAINEFFTRRRRLFPVFDDRTSAEPDKVYDAIHVCYRVWVVNNYVSDFSFLFVSLRLKGNGLILIPTRRTKLMLCPFSPSRQPPPWLVSDNSPIVWELIEAWWRRATWLPAPDSFVVTRSRMAGAVMCWWRVADFSDRNLLTCWSARSRPDPTELAGG